MRSRRGSSTARARSRTSPSHPRPACASSTTVLRGTITPGMSLAPVGQRQLDLGEAMAVGRDRAQHRLAVALGGVEIDAVQVVARLLGRDGEARLVDQALQVAGREREACARSSTLSAGKSSAGSVGSENCAGPLVTVSRPCRRRRAAARCRRPRAACARCRSSICGRHGGGAFALGVTPAPSRPSPCRGRSRSASARSWPSRAGRWTRIGMVLRRSTTLCDMGERLEQG